MTLDTARRIAAYMTLVAIVLFGPILLAQAAQAVGEVVPSSVDPASANEWGGSLIWAFFSSTGMEWLKRNRAFSLLSDRSAFGIQRVMGILLAVAAAIGVHWSYDASAGVLTVSGLLLPNLWRTTSESVRQWVMQEITYRAAVKNFGVKETI